MFMLLVKCKEHRYRRRVKKYISLIETETEALLNSLANLRNEIMERVLLLMKSNLSNLLNVYPISISQHFDYFKTLSNMYQNLVCTEGCTSNSNSYLRDWDQLRFDRSNTNDDCILLWSLVYKQQLLIRLIYCLIVLLRGKVDDCKILLDKTIVEAKSSHSCNTDVILTQSRHQLLHGLYTFLPSVHTNMNSVLTFCEHPAVIISNNKEILRVAKKLQRFNKYFPMISNIVSDESHGINSVQPICNLMTHLLDVITRYEMEVSCVNIWKGNVNCSSSSKWMVFVQQFVQQKQRRLKLEKEFVDCVRKLFNNTNSSNGNEQSNSNEILELEWSNINT